MPKSSILVLDASVVVKWFIPEADSQKADGILNAIQQKQWRAAVPSFLRTEIAHVLWKKKIQGYDQEKAVYIFGELDQLGFDEVSTDELFSHALEASYAYDITIYDAFYVVLAEMLGGTLATFDKELIKKVKGRSSATLLHP